MTKKHALFFLISLAFSSIVVGCFYGEHMKKKDVFFCTADTSIHSGKDTLSLMLNYHMENGSGYMTLEGVLHKSNHNTVSVSLLKSFRYSENDGEFILRQMPDSVLEVSKEDKSILQEYLSDFYLTNNVPTHHVRIKELRKGLWIFTTEPVPYFVCAEY